MSSLLPSSRLSYARAPSARGLRVGRLKCPCFLPWRAMSDNDPAVDLASLVAETGAASVKRYQSTSRIALIFPIGASLHLTSSGVPGEIRKIESGLLNGLPDDYDRAIRVVIDLDEDD